MNRVTCAVILALMSNVFAMAQATEAGQSVARHQITVQGSGVFTRKVAAQGVTYKPTSSGSGMVGYRFNFSSFLGAEVEYDFFRNTQKFETSSTSLWLRTNVHAATGAAVINLPNPLTKRIKSYAMVGGGVLLFDPRDTTFIPRQTANAIMLGGGVDIPITRQLAIRAQAKNLLYKAPEFSLGVSRPDKFSQTMVPSAGLVFQF